MDFMTMAFSVMGILSSAWAILLVVIGFAAVIFVHELGHFLAAKKVGIRVERFAFGFGPRLFGIKRGETDYCVNLLPLGGYVKMTGQEDFQLEKERQPDPGAFNNKSVGARALVIASGVIMNVIFAFVLFMVVFFIGKEYQTNQIGQVAYTSPAYNVLQPGDIIKRMDGWKVDDRADIDMITALYKKKEPMTVVVDRPVYDRPGQPPRFVEVTLKVDSRKNEGGPLAGLKSIQVTPDYLLTVPVIKDKRWPEELGKASKEALISGQLQPGDRIVKARDSKGQFVDVQFWSELVRLAAELHGRPIAIKIERKVDGQTTVVDAMLRTQFPIEASVPRLNLLGAHPRQRIEHIDDNKPAKGVLKEGDVLVRAGEIDYPLFPEFVDAVQAAKGDTMTIVVDRGGEMTTVQVKPQTPFGGGDAKVGILSMPEERRAVVGRVDEKSELGHAGLPNGAAIIAVRAAASQPDTKPDEDQTAAAGPASRPATMADGASQPDQPVMSWAEFYQSMLDLAGSNATIEYRLGGRSYPPLTLHVPAEGWQDGIVFRPASLPLEMKTWVQQTNNPAYAAWLGVEKTGEFILLVYVTLDRLVTSDNVKVKHLMGPAGIADTLFKTARSQFVNLLYLLAMISANLAVINFLPLPIVDGGLMVFLLYEKIRGKPVPLRVMHITTIIGLVLILGLFLLVTWNDIVRLIVHG